jgi:predicted DNA-binding antitoxin AbrB/MazE fold protein
MSQILTATFENGVFIPDQAPVVPAGQRVRLVVDSIESPEARQETLDELDEVLDSLSVHSGGLRLTRDQLHDRG